MFALVAATIPALARADGLDEVRRLEASLEYEQALAAVERLIASGAAKTELAALHFEAGKLAAGLDRAAVAQDHFARALALDGTLVLPPGTSPKVIAPFEAARAANRPLHVVSARRGRAIVIGADPDPLHLLAIAKVRFIDGSGHHQERTTSTEPLAIDLPPDARSIEIVGTDEYGNVLYSTVEPEPALPPIASAPAQAWYASWKLWAGATAFAGGVAGLCAWREGVAQDDWNQLKADPRPVDYSRLRAVEDRGRAWALAANVSFGVAGATAIVGAIALFTHRSEASVAVTAGPGTVGIAGRF